jgi:ribonuclease HI
MEPTEIYVDGAGVRGPGGWGALIIYSNGERKKISGAESSTTNNRMELTAPIMAIKQFLDGERLKIYSDSEYVVKGITKWIYYWLRNGMLYTKEGRVPGAPEPEFELKNKDLWLELLRETKRCKVEWVWVRGHSGIEGNEIADRLAVDAMAVLRSELARSLRDKLLLNIYEDKKDIKINDTAFFQPNGPFKSLVSVITDPKIEYTIKFEGPPDRNPKISIYLKVEENEEYKKKVISEIVKFAVENNYVVQAVNIDKKAQSFWKELDFKPHKGKEKSRTYIANELLEQTPVPNV